MSNGPFGGVVNDLAVAPDDSSVVYAAARGGLFKSMDGGDSWRAMNNGLTNLAVASVAVDPSAPHVVLAGTNGGLFLSQDGGTTWSEVAHDPDRPHVKAGFWAIDFQPGTSTIFALSSYDIYRSDDGGFTWRVIYHQEPETMETQAIANDGQTLFVGGQKGLMVSEDAGSSWRELSIPGDWVSTVATDPSDPSTVYAEAGGDLYKSVDRGSTWSSLLPDAVHVEEVELALGSPRTVYVVGYDHYAFNRAALYAARSDDGGASWKVETRMPGDFLRRASLAVSPHDADVIYLGTPGSGPLKSTDGAATFTPKVQGMTAATPQAVAVDPNDPSRIYASLTLGGSFRSEDAGASWTPISSGLGDPNDPYLPSWINHLVVTGDSTVYAAGGSNDVYSEEPRVFRSSSRGLDWENAAHGLPTHHHVSALISAGPGVLVAGLTRELAFNEGGVYKTEDGGASWTEIGPTKMATRALAFDRLSGTLFALVGRGDTPYQSSLYSSRDGGKSWLPHVLPPTLHDPGSMSVGPTGQVFLGSSLATQIGISRDLGHTWLPIQVGDNRAGEIHSIAQDPLDPTQVFAATGWGGMWVSDTAGATWRQLVPGVFGVETRTIVFGPKPQGSFDGIPSLRNRPLYAAMSGETQSGVWRVFPAPNPSRRPRTIGRPRPGSMLECARGRWSRANTFRFRWTRDGHLIESAYGRRYEVRPSDRGHALACRVTARGPGGKKMRSSRSKTVDR